MNQDLGHTTGAGTNDDLPLAGYAALIGLFGAIITTTLLSRRLRRRLPEEFHAQDIALLGAATYRLSRIVTKDRVTTALRAPFAEYVGPAGAGEVEEESRGRGLQKALGELLTCPFCITRCKAPSPSTLARAFTRIFRASSRFVDSLISITRLLEGFEVTIERSDHAAELHRRLAHGHEPLSQRVNVG